MATPKAGYRTLDGQRIPSVTTIIGRFKDSGALIKWGYSQGIAHENLRSRGLPAPNSLYEVTEKAANAGTIAHDLIEQHVLQGKVQTEVLPVYAGTDPGILEKSWNSYKQFQKWLAQTRIEITHTEMGLVSERYRFGGTLDGVGVDADGTRVLIDWKTSNAVYSDYLIQLAAYGLLLDECEPDLAPKGFHLLRIAKESADFGHLYWGELDLQKESFILMRRLYELDYITKKRVG